MSQVVRAESGFAYGVIGADIHVFGDGRPLYVLENLRDPPEPDAEWLLELPSRMLSARHEIVPFTGRERELADLHRWRTAGGRTAALWLHGPGGQGKTRLAARFAREARADGWKVVTAVPGRGSVLPPPGSQDLSVGGADGLLLIADYADQWPLAHLAWLFSNALLYHPGLPTRLLLLARGADLWPAVRATLADTQVSGSGVILAPLSGEDGERDAMFRAARDAFAARHGTIADLRPPELAGPEFGLTLTVHMAALAAVDAQREGHRPPEDVASLTVHLLDREQRRWARLTDAPEVMNRTVFTAALTGPLEHHVAGTLLESLRMPRAAERILHDHAASYPPADPLRPSALEPLSPDRLAEDFLALTLPGHTADFPAQDWAPATLDALLPRGETPPPSWAARAMTLLTSAAERWPHVRAGYLYPLLRDAPWLAVTGGAALAALAGLDDVDPALLEGVRERLPGHDDAELDPAAAVLMSRLAEHRLAASDDPAEHASVLHDLALSLSGAGRYDESLAVTERSVALYRRLADDEPGRHELDLAGALNNLATRLHYARRPSEALEASRQSVEIRRRHLPLEQSVGLAQALSNYAVDLHTAGRRVEALQADSEALEIYRVAARYGAHKGAIAGALFNLGAHLSALLRDEAAIAATRQGLAMLRPLARDNPAVHEGGLPLGLANVADWLTAWGQQREQIVADIIRSGGTPDPDDLGPPRWREEALEAITQAVEIERRRARANPAALQSSLEGTLRTYGRVLTALGHEQDALAATREADALLAHLGPSAEPHRPPYTPYGEGASEIIDGVLLSLYRYLAAVDLAAYGPDLADRLTLFESDPALFEEAAEIRRRLAVLDPGVHEPEYAQTLRQLGDMLWLAGRRTDSVETMERAAEVTARLAAEDPHTYEPMLISYLDRLAYRLKVTGRRADARAVRHRRRSLG